MTTKTSFSAFTAAALALAAAGAVGAGDKKEERDAPPPASIAAILRLRAKLPAATAPHFMRAEIKGGFIDLPQAEFAVVDRKVAVKVGDRIEERVEKATVTRHVMVRMDVKAVKAFLVSKEGKLEPLAPGRLHNLLNKSTLVLAGDSADVDPRHLELIRTGTIFLLLPPPLEAESLAPR
jgi:hypothetical protein